MRGMGFVIELNRHPPVFLCLEETGVTECGGIEREGAVFRAGPSPTR
jgi:hypothetical protein